MLEIDINEQVRGKYRFFDTHVTVRPSFARPQQRQLAVNAGLIQGFGELFLRPGAGVHSVPIHRGYLSRDSIANRINAEPHLLQFECPI